MNKEYYQAKADLCRRPCYQANGGGGGEGGRR
jgi:hypothetical protein